MSKKAKIDKETAEWVWEKWEEGYTQRDIAKSLNVCLSTVHRRIGKLQDEGRILQRHGRTKKDGRSLGAYCKQ